MKVLLLITSLLLLATEAAFSIENKFPGRSLYPAVPYIQTDVLQAQKQDYLFVDVRTPYEYKTLHIKNSINIPLGDFDFIKSVRKLRIENKNSKIVMFCSGNFCMEAYKAVSKARRNKIENAIVYDAGVMAWAEMFPNEVVLKGKELRDPQKLISHKKFSKHLMTPAEFTKRIGEGSVVVLDVRELHQRAGLPIYSGKEKRISLEDTKIIDKYIRQAKRSGKTLMIYDQSGGQVRLLEYYLHDKKVKSYYFMAGGAQAYFSGVTNNFIN